MPPKIKTLKFQESASENQPLRPREKLIHYGAQSLESWELLALVLRTGTRSKHHQENIEQLAKRLLREAGLKGLLSQEKPQQVKEMFSVYNHHSYQITAISELIRRTHQKHNPFDASSSEKIMQRFAFLKRTHLEQCFVLHLNKNGQAIYQEMVACGGPENVCVTHSLVLRSALWNQAEQIVVVHNHPQGKATPSKPDIHWTLKLMKGAWDLHHIKLQDHIIIGEAEDFSFRDQGLLG